MTDGYITNAIHTVAVMNHQNQIKAHIRGSFEQFRTALDSRENLLIRQTEVFSSQLYQNQKQTSPLIDQIEFLRENEETILNSIRLFGRISYNMSNTFFVMEDYICPAIDHELMYKCLKSGTIVADEPFLDGSVEQKNVSRASNIEIPSHKSRAINEQTKITSITDTNIEPLTPDGKHDDKDIIITKIVDHSKSNKQNHDESDKRQINMKNVEVVNNNTICRIKNAENKYSSSIGDVQLLKTDTLANDDNTNSLHYISQCEFYDRLMTEIKNSINRKESVITGHRKCIQIDQWLQQIIGETEIEPMQNIGILEHNDIQIQSSCLTLDII